MFREPREYHLDGLALETVVRATCHACGLVLGHFAADETAYGQRYILTHLEKKHPELVAQWVADTARFP